MDLLLVFTSILTRLMGLVPCAVAVQFIIDGVKLSGLLKP